MSTSRSLTPFALLMDCSQTDGLVRRTSGFSMSPMRTMTGFSPSTTESFGIAINGLGTDNHDGRPRRLTCQCPWPQGYDVDYIATDPGVDFTRDIKHGAFREELALPYALYVNDRNQELYSSMYPSTYTDSSIEQVDVSILEFEQTFTDHDSCAMIDQDIPDSLEASIEIASSRFAKSAVDKVEAKLDKTHRSHVDRPAPQIANTEHYPDLFNMSHSEISTRPSGADDITHLVSQPPERLVSNGIYFGQRQQLRCVPQTSIVHKALESSNPLEILTSRSVGNAHSTQLPPCASRASAQRAIPAKRRYTQAEWAKVKPLFVELYVEQDLRLKDVIQRISKEHNFSATEQMYKKQISKWGLRKNMAMIQKEEAIKRIAMGNQDSLALASIPDAALPKLKRYIDELAKKRRSAQVSQSF